MEFINILGKQNTEVFKTNIQTVTNTLNDDAMAIMAQFCAKNGNNSSELIKTLSTNFMTKKYF